MYNFRVPIVILDCEMSGLDPEDHQLIQISAIKADPRNLKVLDSYNTFVGPETGDIEDLERKSNKQSLSYSSYYSNKSIITNSPGPWFCVKQLLKWLPDEYILVGYNLDLDLKFLDHALSRLAIMGSITTQKISYRKIDLAHFIEFYSSKYTKPADILNRKLDTVCNAFNLNVKEAHNSLNDCYMVLELLKHLLTITTFDGEKND